MAASFFSILRIRATLYAADKVANRRIARMATMNVPSGQVFSTIDLRIMEGAAKNNFIKWHDEPKKLNSGIWSHIYVNGREDTTEDGDFLRLCARKVLYDVKEMMEAEKDLRRPRFIGVPHVAYGWTPAFTVVDAYEDVTGRDACHAIIRTSLKDHGAHNHWVARTRNPRGFREILFDNTLTSGKSIEAELKKLMMDGTEPNEVDVLVFVDRQQGGMRKVNAMGFRSARASYGLLDMTYALQRLGMWPGDAAERVEREIATNQIK
jgi:orotate phosphoribosyltransferase